MTAKTARGSAGLESGDKKGFRWGVHVRATESGAGCGRHWPLCDGEIMPCESALATTIEYTRRLSSGLAFLPKHPARVARKYAFLFILLEALVGAGLVLFRLVASNETMERVWAAA